MMLVFLLFHSPTDGRALLTDGHYDQGVIIREYSSVLCHGVKQVHSTGFHRLTEMLIG